jgi:hypothetical protein
MAIFAASGMFAHEQAVFALDIVGDGCVQGVAAIRRDHV